MRGMRDRRTWRWLPRRLRFRVLGLVDVVVLWTLVAALTTAGAWWGLDSYRHHRDYCTANRDLRRVGQECIGVTAEAYSFDPALNGILGRIEDANERARTSGKPVVSVAVVMPYTSRSRGAAMSQELIRHSLQGAYVAQESQNGKDTAVQLLFANVGEDLTHWKTVTDALAARRGGDAPVVAAIGFPNSDDYTLNAVKDGLGPAQIPAVSAVLSSREMENPYLFKVSPSTDQLVDALQLYVSANEVDRKNTFMIKDDREDDNYVANLSGVFGREFGEQYGITPDAVERRIETYTGIKGPDQGTPQIFREAVAAMCAVDARTVFLAGRDADLPPFLSAIDDQTSCRRGPDDGPLRILRVSTGRDPDTESNEMRGIAERNDIEIVTAVAVDAPGWRDSAVGDEQVPRAFAGFAASYDKRFEEGPDALDDGYAVMYHDALTAVGTAVAAARDSGIDAVTHNDVYDKLRRGSPVADCANSCVRGASGIFTFVDESAGADASAVSEPVDGRWPVCKPVPIVTFPAKRHDKSPLYRTYQDPGETTCPAP
ncbi:MULTISPECIES: hypothetical protein [Streptomyces]|uniref:hypothetical protein n=1 Tax=Streptomyces TaxID=1883 RepID=UPI001CCD4676|nr:MULTISPECIES: hypothetical protein [Streptomyces]MBZ6139419.1 hypothetical protein [Streptomyces olivaceus]MBZ6167168.1 hypothetical protein [Streptomyces olivaceus]MBZ6173759.1 hypothetical protein [Streptomyces olivaceus]MBZ6179936.1 hypothetical protein [Streptomyces olivaceus]MCM8553114.1 hypothetical protein [Streptomyces sp. STCH 565 A]